jgi:glycerol uptake facilitator-like aquaporin
MLIAMRSASTPRLVGELIGTALLVFFGIGALLASGGQGFVGAVALLVTVTLAYWIFGGHFNPWITLATAIRGAVDWMTAFAIILAQLIGGVVGALLIWGVYRDEGVVRGLGASRISEQTSTPSAVGAAIHAETLAVYLLVSVVFAVGENERLGIAMGLAYAAGTLAIFVVTAASMNLARTLGPDLVQILAVKLDGSRVVDWSSLCMSWVYVVSGALGASLAALIYPAATRPQPESAEPGIDSQRDRVPPRAPGHDRGTAG